MFRSFRNLLKLNLSHNYLKHLPDTDCFEELVSLKILFLHCNKKLTGLPKVIHLTLYSNKVATVPGYRHYMVNCIPSLLTLDYCVITDEEQTEDVSFCARFRAMNKYINICIPEFIPNITDEMHLFNLEVDIYRFKRINELNSPSIRIQSLFRGFRARTTYKNYFTTKKKNIIQIQKSIRGCLLCGKLKLELYHIMRQEGLAHLTLTKHQVKKSVAKAKIFKAVQFRLKRIREKNCIKNMLSRCRKFSEEESPEL
ncbi:unnamed protein product [Moneuplotes crassus]|uniref:Uncharacterized protein n=1 Tax=Euplotes crassus TaxID=5936 RepID=A0AAD2D2C5_EUPCR|nr:unnamed protein product [Moneuplotes crassus]